MGKLNPIEIDRAMYNVLFCRWLPNAKLVDFYDGNNTNEYFLAKTTDFKISSCLQSGHERIKAVRF